MVVHLTQFLQITQRVLVVHILSGIHLTCLEFFKLAHAHVLRPHVEFNMVLMPSRGNLGVRTMLRSMSGVIVVRVMSGVSRVTRVQ